MKKKYLEKKINKYYDLFKKVKHFVFQKKLDGEDLDSLLKTILTDLSGKLDTLLIERYNNKEHEQYNTLLRHYNDIDNNRNNQSTQTNIINTLNEMLKTNNTKLVESSYTIRLIIAICLVIIFIILLIIYLKF
jgi:hypothetical protein